MQRLLLLGLNHTTAPLDVRERLAFTPQQQERAIAAFRQRFPDAEIVLLSTCNRVEVYVAREVHGHPRVEEMAHFLAEFHSIPVEKLRPHLYERSERDVVGHLFAVTASLDSMVLGESQIIGQVRHAYELSRRLGAAGPGLNPLFQRGVAVGRQVLHETQLGDGHVSVSGVAVGYARRIFDRFSDKTVLCIGAGKMAVLALRGFAALKPKQLLICNRDQEKAKKLAADFGATGVPLTSLDSHLVAADIVITSTGATEPIITRKQFEGLLKQRRYRPIFLIDIAVPRDIEAAVGQLDHVFLYNLDDLQKAVAETHAQRGGSLDAARAIIEQQIGQYLAHQQQRELGPAIDKLYKRLHAMAAQEVGRTIHKLPSIGEQEKAHLEDLARRIVNKLLHDPVHMLREGDQLHSPTGQYLHAIERMFRLNEGSADEPADKPDNADAG